MALLELSEDRLFPGEPGVRRIARELHAHVRGLPLLCPHGHVDPALLAGDERFPSPTELLLRPDHYATRMLYSQGVALEELGVGGKADPRRAWRLLAERWHLFRGT